MRTPSKIIIRPLLTEKNLLAKEKTNTLAFEVSADAGKIEIAKAVEELFKTKVAEVRTINVMGKKKRLGRFEGKKADTKKAYVRLKKGQKPVEYFEGL
jgi:large subunit ribosomal protein L23